jgi:hypothetical protein
MQAFYQIQIPNKNDDQLILKRHEIRLKLSISQQTALKRRFVFYFISFLIVK